MWNRFPTEIWLSILDVTDRTGLFNCSLTSKDLNECCNRFIWSKFTIPIYHSEDSGDFYLVVNALLAHPERVRAARQVTISLRVRKPSHIHNSRYIHATMVSHLEQLLSSMTGVTSLKIVIADGLQASVFRRLGGHLDNLAPPLISMSGGWHSDQEDPSNKSIEFFELVWASILSRIDTLPLHTLSTKHLPFHRFVALVAKCPAIQQVEYELNSSEQVSPEAQIPSCQYLARIANGEASVPVQIAANVLNSSGPATSLILQSHDAFDPAVVFSYMTLGQYIHRTSTIQVLTTAELGTIHLERMVRGFSISCPSLRAIVETHATHSAYQPNPRYLNIRVIASIFTMAPSLTTYVSRRADYDRRLWAPYRQNWPPDPHGGAAALATLLDNCRDHFTGIPTSRGVLRIILEAGQLNEDKCLYWVFQRDQQGVWSMYWDLSTEGRIVTPKEREQFYIEPPSA
ncbi:hypothetical protein DL93DRAFT_2096109 [Clavulina sp. PMI_390]|nr:hypothetical protein DL93DRAFT_2096109 [Clavulina sp. PMI_390]